MAKKTSLKPAAKSPVSAAVAKPVAKPAAHVGPSVKAPAVPPPGIKGKIDNSHVGKRVVATKLGYYNHKRTRPGDVFTIVDGQPFSARWMAFVDKRTPEKITTGMDAIQRHHDEVLEARRTGGPMPGPVDESGSVDDDEVGG